MAFLPPTSVCEKGMKLNSLDRCRLLQLETDTANLLQFYKVAKAEKLLKRDKLRMISREIGNVRMEHMKLLKRLSRQNAYMVAISVAQKKKRDEAAAAQKRAQEERELAEKLDTRDWSQLLPEEVCIKLFEFLDDPEDLKKLAQTSPLFYDYLKPRRQAYLFPDVAKVLVQSRIVVNPAEVLKFRLVNTYTKNSVEEALQMVPEHFKRFPERDYVATLKAAQQQGTLQGFEKRERSLVLRLYNHKSEKITQMMEQLQSKAEHYNATNSSPFPTRYLFLQERPPHHRVTPTLEQVFQRQKMTRDFLDVAGQYFWYCDMCTHSHGLLKLTTWYLGIVEFLRRMPKLKALLLHYPLASRGYENAELNQLGEVMNVHPFPVMDNLEMLFIKDIPDSMVTAVLNSNSKCPAVQLDGSPSLLGRGRALESLSFLVTSPSELLSCFRGKRWPNLQHLDMDFTLQGSCVTWQNTFTFLERYQDSLTHLQVSLPWGGAVPTGALAILRLPHVVELRLTLHIFTGIDFILGLTSLKKLHVNITYTHHRFKASYYRMMQVEEKILFNKYYDRLLESNIWEMVPSLRQVRITIMKPDDGMQGNAEDRFVTHKYNRSQLTPGIKNKNAEDEGPMPSTSNGAGGGAGAAAAGAITTATAATSTREKIGEVRKL